MFMKTVEHYSKLKVTYALLPLTSLTDSTAMAQTWGNFWNEFSDSAVLGDCTVMYVDMAFIQKFCGPAAGSGYFVYSSQWENLQDKLLKYRWYRVAGIKVTFTPRIVTQANAIPAYAISGNISEASTASAMPGVAGFGSTNATAAASVIVGRPTYDDINTRSTGFAIPYLTLKSRPFVSNVHINDFQPPNVQKLFDSGYKRLYFAPGRTTSLYYKFFKGTGDMIFNSNTSNVNMALRHTSVVMGWRPTNLEQEPITQLPNRIDALDEQGMCIVIPLTPAQIHLRYTVTFTYYFSFLFNRGATFL